MSTKITYAQLIDALASETGFSKSKTEAFSKALLKQVISELEENGKASITNFGSFKVKDVAERQGKNPQTGEPITIPAHKRVSFTPYKALKEEVNEEYAHLESELMGESTKEETPKDQDPTDTSGETDPFAFERDEDDADATEEEGVDATDLAAEMASRFDESESQDESKEEESTKPEAGKSPFDDLLETTEEEEIDDDRAEPSRPFNFDEPVESDTIEEASMEAESEEEAFETQEEDEPESKPSTVAAKIPGQKYKRKKDNTGIITLAVMTAAIIVIASLWFLMSPDDEGGEMMAQQSNTEEPVMDEAENAPEEKAEQVSSEPTEAESEAMESRTSAASSASVVEAAKKPVSESAEAEEPVQDAMEEDSIDQYEVKANEWYWVIAEKVYGESGYWPLLFQRNETVNDDPDRLYPSAGLKIPLIEGSPGSLSKSDYAKLASAFQMVSDAYTKAGKADKAYQYERNAKRWARLANQ